LIVSLFSLVGG